jgi:hypothetical protein
MKTQKTHLPDLVDTQLVSTVNFIDTLADYRQDVIEMIDYINLYSVGSIHNTNKQLHDPVNCQVEFFNQLNSSELKLRDNNRGVKDPSVESEPTYIDQLSEKFGLDDVVESDTEFIVYWVEKYRTSHDLVKKLLHDVNMLPKQNSTGAYNSDNVYFNDFSESMYSLKSTTIYDAPRECLPVWDVKCTFVKEMGGKHTVPNNYTGTSVFNIHKKTQLLSSMMSRKVTTMFRNNMKNILDCVTVDQRIESDNTLSLKSVKITDSKQPHGGNLVPDSFHVSRMWQNAEPLARIVTESLGNMSYVLNFMDKNLHDNNQAWGRFKTGAQIEATTQVVDLLHDTFVHSFENIPASNQTIESELS